MNPITYNVSFTPQDAAAGAPTVSAVVSYNGTGKPIVRSVLMTAGSATDDTGLDFASVLSALGAAVGALSPGGGDIIPPAADAEDPQLESRPAAAAKKTAARQSPKTSGGKASTAKSAKRTAAKKPTKSVSTVAKKTAAKPAVKSVGGAATAAESSPGKGRRYREMPADFATVYAQTTSTNALVDHYAKDFDGDLPVHTVQGWIRRLKADQAKGEAAVNN